MAELVSDPKELFERWYVAPLRWLETIPNGDGAFIAFSVSIALYERFAKSAAKHAGGKGDENALYAKLVADFSITNPEAEEFWQIMRHGLQHYAMPMQQQQGSKSLSKWRFDGAYPRPIQFVGQGADRKLLVQPWLFRDVVLRLYRDKPELIAYNHSFPWASILPDET